MTIYIALATISYLAMTLAIIRRHKIPSHIYLVSSAIALDLFIVVSLEFQRDAIQTVASGNITVFQQLHAYISTLVVTLYLPMVITGILRFRHDRKTPRPMFYIWHRRLGFFVYILRSLAYIFMFSMIDA